MRWLTGAALALALAGCHRKPVASPPPERGVEVERTVEVPRATTTPKAESPLNGAQWGRSFHADPFVDAHGRQQPHTHLQLMADDANLYVGYYAADEDLRTKPRPEDPRGAVGDRLMLKVGPLQLMLTPKGGDLPQGVTLSTDTDGTVDDPRDIDEEWLAQLTIPWSLLGPRAKEEGVLLRAVRTDAPRREPERALAWPARGFVRLSFSSLRNH